MKEFYFIVNPVAGGGRGKKSFLEAKELLEKKGVHVTYSYSEYPGHAIELARAAREKGEKMVVCVGGDGTVREVAGELVNSDVVLGFLPAGSGNDLCTTLGISTDVESACDVLLTGKEAAIDTATANGTPFFNIGGLGFDVEVLASTHRYKKHFTGMVPYFLGILNTLTHLKRMPLTFVADDQDPTDLESLIFIVANGPRFGGGMYAAPYAKVNDGLFDVCAVKSISFFTFVRLLLCFIKGKHVGKAPVNYFNAKKVTVSSRTEEQFRIELDGEIVETTPVTFEINPSSLKVFLKAQ